MSDCSKQTKQAGETVSQTRSADDLTPGAARQHNRSRRRLLQSLAVGGTAITVKSLPEKWAKPVLDTTIVPAHAECTNVAVTLTCEIDQPDYDWATVGFFPNTSGPWLAGGATGSIGSLDPTPTNVQTVQFSFGDVVATVNPPAAGPVTLNANFLGGDNGGTLGISPMNQTLTPDGGGVAKVKDSGVPVVVGFSSPDDGFRTATMRFEFSAACANPCTIDVVFAEDFFTPVTPGP